MRTTENPMQVVTKKDADIQFQQYHDRLLPYAYSIIGDSLEAEDVVQETLSHYVMSDMDHVRNPRSYLIRSVINRSITAKKRLEVQKKHYTGHWLPSPVLTDDSIYRGIDKDQILNYSLLVLLERLNAKERAVFILKESFDFQHNEIAELLDITVENSRQLFKRSRQKLEPELARSFDPPVNVESTLSELTDAILQADIEKVKHLLSEDVQSISDGGNKHRAAPNIVRGTENVMKFMQAMHGKYFLDGSTYSFATVNHKPAIIFKSPDDVVYRIIILEIINGVIENIYIIVNPDKLTAVQDEN